MKQKHFTGFSLLSMILYSTLSFSQGTTTPNDPNVIVCNQQPSGNNEFEVQPLRVSQRGAYFSHLWWSGDNNFSFVAEPKHTHHETKGNPDFPKVKMSAITTENYGSGGPPPLTYTFTTDIGNTGMRSVLPNGTYIYMQNYRNAVIRDVMYLIVSYGNSTQQTLNGTLKFDVGQYAEISNSILSAHPHFFSNGERWDALNDNCTFQNLAPGEERSILIPVLILQNDEGELTMRVDILKGNNGENSNIHAIDYFEIRPTVAHSHDPNLMIQHSEARNQCDYRGGKIHYTVKFQNEGTGPTSYVRVECQLDDKVDLNEISGIEFPDFYSTHSSNRIVGELDSGAGAIVHIDEVNRIITFEMHDLKLQSITDPNLTNLELARDQIEFDILVKKNYIFGPATVAHSAIYFDTNDPIETNEVQTICGDPLPLNLGGGFQKIKDTRVKGTQLKEEQKFKVIERN